MTKPAANDTTETVEVAGEQVATAQPALTAADFKPVDLYNRHGETRTATTIGEQVSLEFNGFTTNKDRFKAEVAEATKAKK